MKRALVIAGVVAAVLLAVLIGVAVLVDSGRGPQQAFAFYNSAAKPVSVTFHARKGDGTYGGWEENILVPPGELKHTLTARGTYRINVWDGNVEAEGTERLRTIDDVEVKLADGKDQVSPLYVDTTGATTFYVVDATFLYSGSGLSDAIAKAAGAKRDRPHIKAARRGERPFSLPYAELVTPDQKLPRQVASGALVYALVPVPTEVKDPEEIWSRVGAFLEAHTP